MIPPFRQYRTQYFIFFLLLAFPDIFILTYTFAIGPINFPSIYLAEVYLLNFSLMLDYAKLKKYSPFILLSAGILWYYSGGIDTETTQTLIGILFIPIFLIILKRTITELFSTRSINVFMFVLLLYSTTIVLKFLFRFINPEPGLNYFYLITIFNIFIGIFFIFFNYNNSPRISIDKYFDTGGVTK